MAGVGDVGSAALQPSALSTMRDDDERCQRGRATSSTAVKYSPMTTMRCLGDDIEENAISITAQICVVQDGLKITCLLSQRHLHVHVHVLKWRTRTQ